MSQATCERGINRPMSADPDPEEIDYPVCFYCDSKWPNQFAPWVGACGVCAARFKMMGLTGPPKVFCEQPSLYGEDDE